METVVEWLESKEGEWWSKGAHVVVGHHSLIEDHDVLPRCQVQLDRRFANYPDVPYDPALFDHQQCATETAPCEYLIFGHDLYDPVVPIGKNPWFLPRAADVIYSQEYKNA